MKQYPIEFEGGPFAGALANTDRLPPALYFPFEPGRYINVYARSDAIELLYVWDEDRSAYLTGSFDNAVFSIKSTPQPLVTFLEKDNATE